MKEFFF